MPDIATAYVQIVPSARGMGDSLSSMLGNEMPTAGKSAGSLLGSSIFSAVKSTLISLGVGKMITDLIKQGITEGSELEQLRGGVEKIFDQIDTAQIMQDAANAYSELNLSANEYLATINDVGANFAATMGDERGYMVARTGLQAISDYASGTGKSVDVLMEKFGMITRSTSSYQSIADQFSGILPATSAGFLAQAQSAGLLASKYRDLTKVPVAEYQAAVAAMLERGVAELGLTGNTLAETANTYSGSLAAMKAAYSNFLGNLALGEDIGESLNVLAKTVSTFLLKNFLPMIWNIVSALPGALLSFLTAIIPPNIGELVTTMVSTLANFIALEYPVLAEQGYQFIVQMVTGFLQGIPDFLASAAVLVEQLLSAFISALPSLLNSGVQMVLQVAAGLISSLPSIISTAGTITAQFLSKLAAHLPDLLAQGIAMIAQLVAGFISMIPDVISGAGDIIQNIINVFGETDWISLGVDIIKGIISGLWNAATSLYSAVRDIIANALAAGRDKAEVRSPSRLFRRELGQWIPSGAALGVRDGIPLMQAAMTDMIDAADSTFTSRLRMSAGSSAPRQGAGRQIVINQYIYSQAQTAADLMREARYEAEKAVLLGV